jgi:hypothetical protein
MSVMNSSSALSTNRTQFTDLTNRQASDNSIIVDDDYRWKLSRKLLTDNLSSFNMTYRIHICRHVYNHLNARSAIDHHR